ncbi:hypothetical protein A2851_01510 [Candidatus Kaiserbacteria bacterium RIFCSPHIGHO2_01_FULL_53_29]|uniref:GIY-YIG domain-containing protein n=1 Tax=Candidatus Kaiserbacteria bacterium RIFCSPHIGHO2_01_FULL_53_29 TaxID=1798480 RepID=A0A1F6CTQ5_9BACT|nr:MAG: hypothetical protein A2851_01510 [Candidatus Kaiserbacteria bacterium RIFCSPHIGHO2_01_FULL_53_29]
MFSVYVLIDNKGRLYKGMTSNLKARLVRHKNKHTQTTAKMENLSIAYVEKFDNFDDARKRELYLKSAAGRRFLKTKLGP